MKKLFLFFILILFSGPLFAQEGLIGEIRMFAGNFAPRGWALCNGQLLPIAQNQALFSILGTTYGGDGRTTFALPDLRGRVPISAGQGPGLTNKRLGQQGGTEAVTLNTQQMPAHSHTVRLNADTSVAVSDQPKDLIPARNAAGTPQYGDKITGAMNSKAITVESEGGNQAHENMPPYTTVNYIICVQGIFPSRP